MLRPDRVSHCLAASEMHFFHRPRRICREEVRRLPLSMVREGESANNCLLSCDCESLIRLYEARFIV